MLSERRRETREKGTEGKEGDKTNFARGKEGPEREQTGWVGQYGFGEHDSKRTKREGGGEGGGGG
jgi:hypothetical protein